MVGLADCNNFFVSCERSRNEALKGKAVVVLSNNDGCVVARSNEAKRLGIRMGQPAFEIKDLVRDSKVIALSGDHLLYRRISIDVHNIFRKYAPSTIDYSVDEAFLLMDGIPDSVLFDIGQRIANEALEKLDIPITIGFASSKTLAKLVTDQCKTEGRSVGVLFQDPQAKETLLKSTPIGEVWGIGRRLAKKLYIAGVHNAYDLSERERVWIRKMMGVNGERTWRELHGEHCIELSHVGRALQDSISETRTFPEDIDDYEYIRARIAVFAANCARQLRRMNGRAGSINVFLATNPFRADHPQLHPGASFTFPEPISDTSILVTKATELLNAIYIPQTYFKRGGVIFSDIVPESQTFSLFDSEEEITRKTVNRRLMKTVDRLNPKIGRPCLKLASQLTSGKTGVVASTSFQAPTEC